MTLKISVYDELSHILKAYELKKLRNYQKVHLDVGFYTIKTRKKVSSYCSFFNGNYAYWPGRKSIKHLSRNVADCDLQSKLGFTRKPWQRITISCANYLAYGHMISKSSVKKFIRINCIQQ